LKRVLLLLFVAYMLAYTSPVGYAGPKEDYEEAYKIYLAAGASAAAYSGRLGELANGYLMQDGWQIDHYVQAQGRTGARYLIAQKTGVPYYLLAIVGTENKKDIKTDLKVDKVYFAGSNPEEFEANTAKKDIPNTEPKVHKGFNEFVQAGPSAILRNPQRVSLSIPDLLRTDKMRKLLLTGHSLGGAAATLAGARLLSSGADHEQLEASWADIPSFPWQSGRERQGVLRSASPAQTMNSRLAGYAEVAGRERMRRVQRQRNAARKGRPARAVSVVFSTERSSPINEARKSGFSFSLAELRRADTGERRVSGCSAARRDAERAGLLASSFRINATYVLFPFSNLSSKTLKWSNRIDM